ncbi:phenylalanine--tRNA ligase alpha subunit-like [Planoprotostelium fungivorum]|uniref:phenylalanine--tRNA ligase n=1 Tax=Planoprotostelium fungivorum TaxID=1890364 RepID=A0A2P6NAZ5_9EUKA|nr:phenylalanine--tRNA ligase alpha subunit-like [Planoprotostelium fungivorum]
MESKLLQSLNEGPINDTGSWTKDQGLPHDDTLVGAILRLEGLRMIVSKINESKITAPTAEGSEIIEKGSPEYQIFQAIPSGSSKSKSELEALSKIGFMQAMKSQWIAIDKASGAVTRKVEDISDSTKDQLLHVRDHPEDADPKIVDALKKRKLVSLSNRKTYTLTKGENFALEVVKPAADLTAEMLSSGSWKDTKFKDYNLDADATRPASGHFHPLLKVRSEYREIFLELGFTEMPTNSFVENCFWNFDTLMVPQQHPARDLQDTFFLSDPATSRTFPEDYLKRVQTMHEEGGSESIGWRYPWKRDETTKNILRTHTTAVSARMLYKLAQDGFKPKKYFSIDRVFRNETLDATHLAEFHQIEGVIADYDLTLGDLIGLFSQFYARLGIEKLRFKPAFNPYTEPSMEIFSYHEGLKKWVEVGNSGIFRPEMLIPMGIPKDVKVLAWGLSLERPTMIKYGISNIRELIGHKTSIQKIQDNPVCRLDA